MNSQKTPHTPSHVSLKTMIQNNETVCSPYLSENPNDISCVNTDWITLVSIDYSWSNKNHLWSFVIELWSRTTGGIGAPRV